MSNTVLIIFVVPALLADTLSHRPLLVVAVRVVVAVFLPRGGVALDLCPFGGRKFACA
jgi:hypothetical protein